MPKIFGRKDKAKEKMDAEHATAISYAEQARPSEMIDREMALSLGRSIYMIHDPEFLEWLLKPDEKRRKTPLYDLYPAFSMLNRTSNIGQHDKDILLLDYDYLLLTQKMNMKEEDFEDAHWSNSSSAMRIFSRMLVNDAQEGWKGKLTTEQIKRIVTEIEKHKKKGIMPF